MAAEPASKVIVALDVDPTALAPLLDELAEVPTLKIGMEAFYAEGAPLVRLLRERGHDVFLDLKLHDIPNTVSKGAAAIARLGVRFLTVHAAGGPAMIEAAVRAVAEVSPETKLLGVTMLTSLRGDELPGVWDDRTSVERKVLALAEIAVGAGCHGLVASPHEARALRQRFGDRVILVCPGIRPTGSGAGDQARVATPEGARREGADYLVVGRPILRAPRPSEAFRAIVEAFGHG
jgi:orotidine-5'-phosphate decarboxylase